MVTDLLRNLQARFQLELNAGIVYALRIAGAFLTFVLQVVLARWMGQFEYGIFAFVWSCVIILGELLSFGFYNLIQRLIPEYRVQKSEALLRGAIWGASHVIIIASLAITGFCLALLYGLYSAGIAPANYAFALMFGALALPAFALADYLSGIGRSYGWMVRAFAPTALFRPIAIIGLLAGIIALGASESAVTAMAAATAAVWLTLIVAVISIGTALPAASYQGTKEYRYRPWIIAALPMMMVSSFELLLFNVDVLMISYFLPADKTGIYFAATKIMALVAFMNFAVGSAFTAQYAEHHASDNKPGLIAAIRRSASLIFYPSVIMIIAILLLRNELLGLFGAGFTAAHIVIFPLAAGLICRAFVGPGERVMMMTGQQGRCAAIYLGTVVIDILLNLLLIPRYGIEGAAIATAISFALMALMLFISIRQRLGISSLPFGPRRVLRGGLLRKMN